MDNKHRSQLEINDLIGDAVNNAVARRSQIDSESALSALSDEQARSITGGKLSIKIDPTTLGYKGCPPVTVGLMLPPEPNYETFKIQALG